MKILLLHNIRSVYNVGAIFRTADAVGLDLILLSGYTPTPVDRFGRARKDLAKSSLGAEEFVDWKYIKNLEKTLSDYKNQDYSIIVLEQDPRSFSYKKTNTDNKNVLLVVGSETDGVDKETLDFCDQIIEIPMKGHKESLNVSVATGIAMYALFS